MTISARRRSNRRAGLLLATFLVGVIAGMLFLTALRDTTPAFVEGDLARYEPAPPVRAASPPSRVSVRPAPLHEEPPRVETTPPTAAPALAPAPSASGIATVAGAVADLRQRNLFVPVQGVTRADLRDSFRETRDGTRPHEALDILAPRGTPVVAAEDGTIAKLFTSVRGGLTIYQFDPSRTYAYYYAHLDRYAPGLREGARISGGQTVGFVGTTGNAPKNTPHLHFAIFLLTDEKHWWEGTAVNAFDIWKR